MTAEIIVVINTAIAMAHSSVYFPEKSVQIISRLASTWS